MTLFDKLFFSVFNYYKQRKNKNATRIATWYITIFQCGLILLLGIFFSEFFKNMNMVTLSASSAWLLFGVVTVVLYFKNWIQYSGRKRRVLNAKYSSSKSFKRNIFVLWLLPVLSTVIAIALLQILN
jgi:hypothetical protein